MNEITGTFRLGPDSGRVLIKTGRAGLAARAGHDLTMEITRWSATVTVPGGDAAAAVTAELDLGSLAVREGTGGAKPLSDKDRGDILNQTGKILGRGTASFASTGVISAASGPAASGTLEGTLTLGGRTQPVRLELVGQGPGRYQGTATVRQTEYGITPYSGFFGTLKLKDEVGVEVEADLNRAVRG